MPITGPPFLSPISQDEFAQLDYRVMQVAFECQNQLGRLCDEAIYQNDLVARLEAAGIEVIPVPGGELAGCRGGPRAICCPIGREPSAMPVDTA